MCGVVVWFYFDFYLDFGFYEIDIIFYFYVYLNFYGFFYQFCVIFNECGFVFNGNYNKLLVIIDSNVKGIIEIKECFCFYVVVFCLLLIEEYFYIKQFFVMLFWDIWVNIFFFFYCVVDFVVVVVFDVVNMEVQNSLQQSNDFEFQWVGFMFENFVVLDFVNFFWDFGFVGVFFFVFDIFMCIWGVMGKYNIFYVFLFIFGVVFLLIGCIVKFE